MGVFEYKTHITHQEIDENNRLSDRGLTRYIGRSCRNAFRRNTDIA